MTRRSLRRFRAWRIGRLTLVLATAWLAGQWPGRAGSVPTVSFRNDVMAVLSKAGCNSGPCHGNANGKGGFKLSLRGEDAEFDLKALTRDMFGRRVDPEDPSQSLILLKPTTQLAHEGGQRFKKDSEEYRILREWNAEGRSEEHTSELQSRLHLVCRLLLEKKKKNSKHTH